MEQLCRIRDTFIKVPVFRDAQQGAPIAYFRYTDYTVPVNPSLVDDMAQALCDAVSFVNVDLLVSFGDRITAALVYAVATKTGLPFVTTQYYPAGSAGEVELEKFPGHTGSGSFFLNGLKKGKNVIIIADVLRTGDSITRLISGCARANCTVTQIAVAAEVVEAFGRQHPQLQNYNITSLVKIHVRGEKTKEMKPSPIPSSSLLMVPRNMPSLVRTIKQNSPEAMQAKIDTLTLTFGGLQIMQNTDRGTTYFFSQLMDCIPAISPEIVEDVADLLVYYGDFARGDIIVGEATRGCGSLIHAVAMRTGQPYIFSSRYPIGEQSGTVASAAIDDDDAAKIYINGLKEGLRCVVVCSLLDNGTEIEPTIKAIESRKAFAVEGMFMAEKLFPPKAVNQLPLRRGKDYLGLAQPNFEVTTLVQFQASGDRTQIISQRIG